MHVLNTYIVAMKSHEYCILVSITYSLISPPGNNVESLMRVMNNIYAPIFFENTSWPDSIKNDFSAQLHKFLATLTDTR